jgi:hypothetical protein
VLSFVACNLQYDIAFLIDASAGQPSFSGLLSAAANSLEQFLLRFYTPNLSSTNLLTQARIGVVSYSSTANLEIALNGSGNIQTQLAASIQAIPQRGDGSRNLAGNNITHILSTVVSFILNTLNSLSRLSVYSCFKSSIQFITRCATGVLYNEFLKVAFF